MPNSGEETVPHLQLMEKMPLSCRPLWLAHHSPLVKESRGGQLLPANRIQVKKKPGTRIRQLFLQTVSLPETLNQMPVVFNREAFFIVIVCCGFPVWLSSDWKSWGLQGAKISYIPGYIVKSIHMLYMQAGLFGCINRIYLVTWLYKYPTLRIRNFASAHDRKLASFWHLYISSRFVPSFRIVLNSFRNSLDFFLILLFFLKVLGSLSENFIISN